MMSGLEEEKELEEQEQREKKIYAAYDWMENIKSWTGLILKTVMIEKWKAYTKKNNPRCSQISEQEWLSQDKES